MEKDSTKALGNVIRIDDERIQDHLKHVVRGSVEETLNALLEAEADRLVGAARYERNEARQDTCPYQKSDPDVRVVETSEVR